MRKILCTLMVALSFVLLPSLSPALQQQEEPVRWAPETRAQRIDTSAGQRLLNSSAPWRAFLSQHGSQWQARWDEATGSVIRLWGQGWDEDPAILKDDSLLWGRSTAILKELESLHGAGLSPSELVPLVIDRRAGITTVTFEQRVGRVRVHGARISLRFKAGRFVMAQLEVVPGLQIDPTPSIHSAAAAAQARQAMAGPTEATGSAELVILPLIGQRIVRNRLAWRIPLRSLVRPSRRDLFVDAHSGELLAWEEHVRFAQGTVLGELDNRYPAAGLTESPLPWVTIEGGGQATETDADGLFTLEIELPEDLSWTVGSSFFDIESHSGEDRYTFEDELGDSSDTVLGQPDPDAPNSAQRRARAQMDVHRAAHIARERLLEIAPDLSWVSMQIPTHVNRGGSVCNAWWEDWTLNFVRQGGDCHNSGRIADVVYHEYGHGMHASAIIPGAGAFDGALSEGLADFMSATITGSADMSPGFFLNGDWPLRDLAPDHRWPEDISDDTHATGLILGGALWDLRVALIEELGPTDGIAQTEHIFAQIAARAADIPDSYAEALLADDDNGNLSDGTPNQCIIDSVFALHGLSPAAEGEAVYALNHSPLGEDLDPEAPLAVEVEATLVNGQCAEGDIASVQLQWLFDPTDNFDGASVSSMETQSDGLWHASLPATGGTTNLCYRIEAFAENGDRVAALPLGSVSDPWYCAWVGEREILFEANFEEDDGGFTSELVEGSGQLGSNDWTWGPAGGLAGDPSQAFSGDNLWGNDIAPGDNWNGLYQANVHNRLVSPVIEVETNDSLLLQFRRWLTVEDGYWDQAQLKVNGHSVWTQYASTTQDSAEIHHEDHHWAFRSYPIGHLISTEGTVQMEWELISDGGMEFGGWNIDDVRLVLPVGAAADPIDNDDDDDAGGDEETTSTGASTPQQEWDGGSLSGGGCACTTLEGRPQSHRAGLLLSLLLVAGLRRRGLRH